MEIFVEAPPFDRAKSAKTEKKNKNKQTKQIKMKFQNLLTGEIEGRQKKKIR
jgi:hypothetical protein